MIEAINQFDRLLSSKPTENPEVDQFEPLIEGGLRTVEAFGVGDWLAVPWFWVQRDDVWRKCCLEILGKTGRSEALPVLMELLCMTQPPEVAHAVARVMSKNWPAVALNLLEPKHFIAAERMAESHHPELRDAINMVLTDLRIQLDRSSG